MTLEQQAKELADWLDQNPGCPAPEGVDAEVLEAIYVLRPDLAPPPNVSIDTILDQVESGPFAQTPAARDSRRPMRFWTGLGSLAAAAAVLIIALPQQDELQNIGPQLSPDSMPTREAPLLPASPPPSTASKSLNGDTEPSPDDTLQGTRAQEQATMAPRPMTEATPATESDTELLQALDGQIDQAPEDLGLENEAILGAGEDAAGNDLLLEIGGIGSRGALSGGEGLSGGGGLGSSTTGRGAARSNNSASETRRAAPAQATPASEEYADMEEDSQESGQSAPESEEPKRGFGLRLRSSQSQAAATPPAPATRSAVEPAPMDMASETITESNEATGPTQALRSQAYPEDYQPPSFANSAPLTPAQQQWLEADKTLALLNQSRHSEALEMANSALGISSENTPSLSLLYWIQGECLLMLGQKDSAQTAFELANQFNQAR